MASLQTRGEGHGSRVRDRVADNAGGHDGEVELWKTMALRKLDVVDMPETESKGRIHTTEAMIGIEPENDRGVAPDLILSWRRPPKPIFSRWTFGQFLVLAPASISSNRP